jgi:hypothetical protein
MITVLTTFCFLPAADTVSPVIPGYHVALSNCAVLEEFRLSRPTPGAEINREYDPRRPRISSDGSGSIAFAGILTHY